MTNSGGTDQTAAVGGDGPTSVAGSVPRRHARRPWEIVLLPRRQELLKVGWLLIAATVTSVALPDGVAASWGHVAVLVVSVELLAYQARYAVNDLLDRRHDHLHPAASRRRRLRPDASRALRTAVLVGVVVRPLAAVAATLLLPAPRRTTALRALVLIFVVGLIYEQLRSGERKSMSGGRAWETAAPGGSTDVTPAARTLPVAALQLFVGSGYALRVHTGVVFQAPGAPGWAQGVFVAYGWSFGVMVVSMVWVFEAALLMAAGNDGLVCLRGKAHLAALWARAEPSGREGGLSARPFAAGSSHFRVWDLALVVGSSAGVLAGWALAEGVVAAPVPSLAVWVAVGAVASLSGVGARQSGWRRTMAWVLAILVGTAATRPGTVREGFLAASPLVLLLGHRWILGRISVKQIFRVESRSAARRPAGP